MNLLVTAGNTVAPIDRVRCLTNIFTGRTGAAIALHAHGRGHTVALLTSHPETVAEVAPQPSAGARWSVVPYRTFDQLQTLMAELVAASDLNAVIHSAAVSDYLSAGVYAPAKGTRFDPASWEWRADETPTLVDRSAGKIKSDAPELWLRLVRAPKLIDMVRGTWGFRGLLVKFKLEVDVDDARLLEGAERSRVRSASDLMVANTLEGASSYAFLGPLDGAYRRMSRRDLPARLIDALEKLHHERRHG
jgi:phosphopantothenoylcysteine synthetase/decarboxylase